MQQTTNREGETLKIKKSIIFLFFLSHKQHTLKCFICHSLWSRKSSKSHSNLRDCEQIYGSFCSKHVFGKYHRSLSWSLGWAQTPQELNMKDCNFEESDFRQLKYKKNQNLKSDYIYLT